MRGPMLVTDEAAALLRLVELEPSVLASIQMGDAEEAVTLNIQKAYREASEVQVKYQWLKSAFEQEEAYTAWPLIKEIGAQLLALGLSDVAYADMLNTTEDEAKASREQYEYLLAQSPWIEAYITVQADYK